jgi:DNA-binding transcriptional LysR family regulator
VSTLPWIASTLQCPFEAISDGHFARHGRTPPKIVLADDGATKVDLVRAGLGAAVMERSEAEAAAAQGGVAMWMPDGLASALHFAWPVSHAHDPALAAVRTIVTRLWSPPAA